MEGKVVLYDSNNAKIGETYTRRARQLVKQQRASWVDESQGAIKFAPGMEHMDDPAPTDMPSYDIDPRADKELMKLAKRRVHARFAFRLHASLLPILSAFFILIYALTDPGGYFWPVWPILAIGLGVAIHGAVYKLMFGSSMTDKITREYEQLRFEHSWVNSDDRRG